MNSAKSHDKSSIKSKDYISLHSNGYKGKFSQYNMQLTMFEGLTYKIAIYLVSYLIKLITMVMLMRYKTKGSITAF